MFCECGRSKERSLDRGLLKKGRHNKNSGVSYIMQNMSFSGIIPDSALDSSVEGGINHGNVQTLLILQVVD